MRITLTNLLILLSLSCFAQQPLYKHYTIKDGLPTDEVYAVLQDSNGYMWFGTDIGLVRFDGKDMKVLTTSDGLTSNVVLKLFNGINKVWIASYTEGCSFYKDGKIKPAPFNSAITPKDGFVDKIVEVEEGDIYFTTINTNDIHHYKNGKYETITPDSAYNGNEKLKYVRFFKEINGEFFTEYNVNLNSADSLSDYGYENKPYPRIALHKQPNLTCLEISLTTAITEVKKLSDGSILFSLDNIRHFVDGTPHGYFLKLNNNRLDTIVKHENVIVNGLFIDKNKNLFVMTRGEGAYIYKNENLNSPPINILPGTDIGSICEDFEGNYWFSTSQNGVFQIPSLEIIKISGIKDEKIYKVGATQNELIIEDEAGNYYIYKDNSIAPLPFSIIHPTYFFTSKKANELLYIKDNTCYIYNTVTQRAVKGDYTGSVNDIFEDNKYTYSISTAAFNIHNNLVGEIIWRTLDKSKKRSRSNYKKLYVAPDKTVWVGSLVGLHKLVNEELTFEYPNPIIERITHIEGLGNSYFAVSKKESGLIIRKGDENIVISKKDGLPSDIITCMHYDGDALWIATSQGFCAIKFNKTYTNYTINRYDIFSTSVIGIIKSICKYNGFIFLGTSTGLYKFSPNEFSKKNINLPITLLSVNVNNSEINYAKILEYKPHQNNFEFIFQGFSYTSPKELSYKCVLNGYNTDTIFTDNPSIQFTNLSAGKYTFVVYASTNMRNWSINPAVYTFNIAQHYTETWWFISLIVLAGILIVSSIFLLIIRNLNRRSILQRNLLLSEQKALRAQMNPHFTFNALNSIQYFLTDNDKRSATTFLSKFSMLVRKVLYNSNNNLITLEEEITTLKLYLDLEVLRFGDKLKVNINIDDDVYTEEILVPSMIIQPFLENAIWHGIMPKESGKGNLTLNFKMEKDKLVCIIKDDGIGRVKSAELKAIQRKGHKSTGLKNIEDRISVLNHINKNQISLTVNDLYDKNNNAAGTEVVIYFETREE